MVEIGVDGAERLVITTGEQARGEAPQWLARQEQDDAGNDP